MGLAMLVGCASRGGYAEPGPMSPNANPPSPASIQSGSVLQPSTATGTPGESPPAINAGGAQVPDQGHHGHAQTPATECSRDADCAPAECCHPSTCVPAGRAPACDQTVCSSECRPATLDCGQGHCACISGRCGAVRGR